MLLSWKDKKSGVLMFAAFDVVSNETHDAVMQITSHPVEEGANVSDHARPEPIRLTVEGYVSNTPLFNNHGVRKYAEVVTTTVWVPPGLRGIRPPRVELEIPKPNIKPNVASVVEAGIGALVGAITGNNKTFAQLAAEPPADGGTMKAQLLKITKERADIKKWRAEVEAGETSFGFEEWIETQSGVDAANRARQMFETLVGAQREGALLRVETRLQKIDNMMIERVSVPRSVEDGNGATFNVDLLQVRIVASKTTTAPEPAEERGKANKDQGSKNAKTPPVEKIQKYKSTLKASKDAAVGFAGRGGADE